MAHEEIYFRIESELKRFIPNLEEFVGELPVHQSEEVARTLTSKYGNKFMIIRTKCNKSF